MLNYEHIKAIDVDIAEMVSFAHIGYVFMTYYYSQYRVAVINPEF
jgi:hypothetical protein